ncbi:hypothetical protein [Methanospirillum purgamenti]|uniref:hypothetical protein n=1 Tax=Methanospirillum purgamenti TaxID=2834276 RepID=UPI00353022FF
MEEVPVDMCDNCGEIYVPDKIAEQIMFIVESAESEGIILDVQNFPAEISAVC